MDFITIDFETATSERDSPCEIGLTFVRNNQITNTKSWLIKPKYNYINAFNTFVHGINYEDVECEPEFDSVWTEVLPLIDNQLLVAHNAGFDISVLRKTLELYNISFPTLDYVCSYILSKKIWVGLASYDLKTLCKLNDIEFVHHRAGSDSRATAELTLKAFELARINNVDDITEKLNTSIGCLYPEGYTSCITKRNHTQNVPVVGDITKNNPLNIFYGNTVVFTGTLSSMVRAEAQKIILDIGGVIGVGVTKDTNYLVIGQQDYRVVGEDGMSSKQEKAIKLIEKGMDIEILSEADFLKNI